MNSRNGILRYGKVRQGTDWKASSPEVLPSNWLPTWLSRGASPGLESNLCYLPEGHWTWKPSSRKLGFSSRSDFSLLPSPSKGHLAMSEDIGGCHSRWGGGFTSILWGEAEVLLSILQDPGQLSTEWSGPKCPSVLQIWGNFIWTITKGQVWSDLQKPKRWPIKRKWNEMGTISGPVSMAGFTPEFFLLGPQNIQGDVAG